PPGPPHPLAARRRRDGGPPGPPPTTSTRALLGCCDKCEFLRFQWQATLHQAGPGLRPCYDLRLEPAVRAGGHIFSCDPPCLPYRPLPKPNSPSSLSPPSILRACVRPTSILRRRCSVR